MNKQAVYERLVEYIVENQDRFYRLAYSYTRQKQDTATEKTELQEEV